MPPPPGTIIRVNTAADGTQANDQFYLTTDAFSPDGTRVLFASGATNLVPGDTNGTWDIFAKDLTTGAITRVNTAADGTQSHQYWLNNLRFFPDNARVLFESPAWTLVPGDTNDAVDLFIKDLATGAVTRVNTAADGTQANAGDMVPDMNHADISADGTRILFLSPASNLVPDDTNGEWDLFVKDLATGAITRVNTAADGTQAHSGDASHLSMFEISPDGTHVLFYSEAANLVPDDTNGHADFFIKNLITGAIARSRLTTDAINDPVPPRQSYTFSADGTAVLLYSRTSLLPGDTNGVGGFFVQNLDTGTITRARTPKYADMLAYSRDGTHVLFWSDDPNLVAGDTSGQAAPFVKDLATGAITRVNFGASIQDWRNLTLSPDGTRVMFASAAADLVSGDTNDLVDIFVATLDFPATSLAIAATDAARPEGASGFTALTLTLTRAGITSAAATVAWAVAGSGPTPAGAEDFAGGILPSGTISFAAAQTTATITVLVAGDTAMEPDEGFTVTLGNADPGLAITTATASGFIGNDDDASTDPMAHLAITAADAARAEGDAGSTAITFNVTRSGNTQIPASAAWTLRGTGLRPTGGGDFTATTRYNGTVSFGAFENAKTITLRIAGDTDVEPDETFELALFNPSPDTEIDIATAQGTIQADDAIPDDALRVSAFAGQPLPAFYQGPVAGLEREWIHAGTQPVHVATNSQNWFIRTGGGDDAIVVSWGTNVLDGGGGSNLLIGSYGQDTFFVDAHNPAAPTWSTIARFDYGDAATLWGIDEADFVLEWLDNLGAGGFTGLTLLATAPGAPTTALTVSGYSTADLANGTLAPSFGFDPVSGSPYLHIAHG